MNTLKIVFMQLTNITVELAAYIQLNVRLISNVCNQ